MLENINKSIFLEEQHPLLIEDENIAWLLKHEKPQKEAEEKWKLSFSKRICENICYYFKTYKCLKLFAPNLVSIILIITNNKFSN